MMTTSLNSIPGWEDEHIVEDRGLHELASLRQHSDRLGRKFWHSEIDEFT